MFSFIKGDYEDSESNFKIISDRSSDKNTNIVILSKIGRALIAYNQERYEKAIEYFASLIKEYNYVNENILERIGICYYKANKVKKAKEIFEATIAQYPNNYKVKTYFGVLGFVCASVVAIPISTILELGDIGYNIPLCVISLVTLMFGTIISYKLGDR